MFSELKRHLAGRQGRARFCTDVYQIFTGFKTGKWLGAWRRSQRPTQAQHRGSSVFLWEETTRKTRLITSKEQNSFATLRECSYLLSTSLSLHSAFHHSWNDLSSLNWLQQRGSNCENFSLANTQRHTLSNKWIIIKHFQVKMVHVQFMLIR